MRCKAKSWQPLRDIVKSLALEYLANSQLRRSTLLFSSR